jgi:hypothetical protein
MTHISWTTYSCPNCKRSLGVRAGRKIGTTIGAEYLSCEFGEILKTGNCEWADLNRAERRRYFLPMIDVSMVCGAIILLLIFSRVSRVGLYGSFTIVAMLCPRTA